ncbi:MAG: hypothetical protein AB7S26_27650 [Sandaracinaceae bacterium]
MAKEPPRRSRLQRALVSIPVMLVLTELGAALIWMATARECFSYDAMQARRDTLIESSPLAAQGMGRLGAIEAEEALHPYVGYVQVDGDGSDSLPYPRTEGLYERRSNALRVVVVGGSVAGQLEEDLPEAIDGRRPGRAPCRVWNLGTGGFKEPQQLALVTYLLTMGAEWDVLVNVDGFNEAVLPIAENVPAHVYPYYPREWSRRAVELSDAELLASIGQVQVWRDMRVDAARWVTNAPLLRWSATANVVCARSTTSSRGGWRAHVRMRCSVRRGRATPTEALPRRSTSARCAVAPPRCGRAPAS